MIKIWASLCVSIEFASLSVISLLWSCFITLGCIYQMSLQAWHQTDPILLLLLTSGEAVNWFKDLLLWRLSAVLSRRPKQRQQHGRKSMDPRTCSVSSFCDFSMWFLWNCGCVSFLMSKRLEYMTGLILMWSCEPVKNHDVTAESTQFPSALHSMWRVMWRIWGDFMLFHCLSPSMAQQEASF